MGNVIGHDGFKLSFLPEKWDSFTKFKNFKYNSPEDHKYYILGMNSISDHKEKFKVLADITQDILPGFDIEQKELKEHGYSSVKYSRRYAAIIECLISELYSILDGLKNVIYSLYPKVQGISPKKVSKLFTNAKKEIIDDKFPIELQKLLIQAHDDWFLILRKYRTLFIHGNLGYCKFDEDNSIISYVHHGLGASRNEIIIDNITQYVNDSYTNCLTLVNDCFDYFYENLKIEKTIVICGFYQGLVYQRQIEPEDNLTFNSGICLSTKYETPCPLKDKCKAHNKAIEQKDK